MRTVKTAAKKVKKQPTSAPKSSPMRKRTGKKSAEVKYVGTDAIPIEKPRGGYAHKGREGRDWSRFPTIAEIEEMGLGIGKEYPKGEVPEPVMQARRQVVRSMMVAGAPSYEIEEACGQRYGMSATMTTHVMRVIRRQWRADLEEQSAYARVEVIQRLKRDLLRMRTTTPRPWADIARHEKLLASIEGTEAPMKLEVTNATEVMKDALTGIMTNMSEDEMVALVTEGHDAETAIVVAAE